MGLPHTLASASILPFACHPSFSLQGGGVGGGGSARPAQGAGAGSEVSCESAGKCPCLLVWAGHLLTHVGETQEGEDPGRGHWAMEDLR